MVLSVDETVETQRLLLQVVWVKVFDRTVVGSHGSGRVCFVTGKMCGLYISVRGGCHVGVLIV